MRTVANDKCNQTIKLCNNNINGRDVQRNRIVRNYNLGLKMYVILVISITFISAQFFTFIYMYIHVYKFKKKFSRYNAT